MKETDPIYAINVRAPLSNIKKVAIGSIKAKVDLTM